VRHAVLPAHVLACRGSAPRLIGVARRAESGRVETPSCAAPDADAVGLQLDPCEVAAPNHVVLVSRNQPRRRQLCWAHLLRNFRGLEEFGGKARSLGVGGQRIVKAVFREWYRYRDGELTRRGLRRRLVPIRLDLHRLLRRHVNNPASPARKIAKDLREYGAALWTFARVEGIEPTNNLAERALRKAVLWRKNSYGAASRDGSLYAERMLTVCESLRAQERSILDFLVASIRATLSRGHLPTLLPA